MLVTLQAETKLNALNELLRRAQPLGVQDSYAGFCTTYRIKMLRTTSHRLCLLRRMCESGGVNSMVLGIHT